MVAEWNTGTGARAPEATAVERRPAAVWSLALILAAAGAMCLLAAAFPISETAPVRLASAVGAGLLVAAGALFALGARVPGWALHAVLGAGTVLTSVLVAASTTDYGAALTSFAYIWIAIYAGYFFSRRAVRLHAALIAAAAAAGFALGGLPGMWTAWALVSVSAAVAGEALSWFNARIRAQIATDPLTGLLNRSGLGMTAQRLFAFASRTDSPISVALIDLDDFKQVNDRDGHAAGDELLADLGLAWQRQLRRSEALARLGGDEFVFVLPGADLGGAQEALGRLRAVSPVRWSAGVVERRGDEPLEQVLRRADEALYRAKARARGADGDERPGEPLEVR